MDSVINVGQSKSTKVFVGGGEGKVSLLGQVA